MPPPEVPSPPFLHQLTGTLLPQNGIFTLGGTEKGDFREELSQPSNLVLHMLLWPESFWNLCFGHDSNPLVLSQIPSWPNTC